MVDKQPLFRQLDNNLELNSSINFNDFFFLQQQGKLDNIWEDTLSGGDFSLVIIE